ncbi:SDR family NAD(P)-dependent oxidoreductase [Mariluticola halotolerans]|uniref:SDR family NAD(P)-dependent oxidoreductase n=1 Tax=Mariluticola halotolerans TaxID=2909283 RepID=UPI0026E44AE7|nr:SDR family oxidoreductase [Mariluticola halotolerans]UJQ94122.1 SDR family oxidoreductase [Mariluticola halotolerans]
MKILVTGASEGIGGAACRVIAQRCKEQGQHARIALVVTGTKSPPNLLLSDLKKLDAETLLLSGDLAEMETCRRISAEAVEFCEGMDVFVSNAGTISPARLAQMPIEAWDRQFNLNARATLAIAQGLYEHLRQSKGAIVGVASMSGMFAHQRTGAYSPSKAAMISLCRNLAQDWAEAGIRVNTVSPGMIHTPLTEKTYAHDEVAGRRRAMVPLGRIGRSEDIAEAIWFLCSPASSYITGQNLLVDGGLCDSLLGTIPTTG